MSRVSRLAIRGKAPLTFSRSLATVTTRGGPIADVEDVVIGGGIVGVCTAHALARRGRKVTVLERRGAVGEGSSYINGTLICPSLMIPWTGPQMIPKLLKSFVAAKHPLKVHPQALLDVSLWRFGLHYLASCKPGQASADTGHLARLAAYSRACLDRLAENDASLCSAMDQTAKGTLQVFDDAESMKRCLAASREIRAAGVPLTVLTPEECGSVDLTIVEALRAQGKEAVYIFSELDTNGDCHKLTRHLAADCERMGVQFEYDCKVENFHRNAGTSWDMQLADDRTIRASNVVLCAGTESPQLASALGLSLPMYPVKGYAVTIPLQPGAQQLRANVVQDSKKLYLAPLGPKHIRITGCAEFEGSVATLDRSRADILVEQAMALLPGMLDPSGATYYAGLRPLSADDVPILGETGNNVYLNTGHGSKGWTHAFGSAEIVADMILGRQPEIDPTPYDLARFWPLRQRLSRFGQLPAFLQSPSRVSGFQSSTTVA